MSLYKETLMKHFRNPKHKVESLELKHVKDGVNPSCGDNITIYYSMTNGLIDKISYTGNGCAISMASADIMCEVINNFPEPNKLINNFISMIKGDEISFPEKVNVLEVFKELQDYPARRSCALLPWNTLLNSISELEVQK